MLYYYRWGDFMFYKQSITDIKVVILTLDGGLLDVNRLRYNYFKRLCKQYDKSVNRAEFSEHLGNMNTMYLDSPIKEQMSDKELNLLVEKDLFAYAKLKPAIQKDGIEELLQFFVQRNIKVVVVSTHKTKRAIQYLQLTRLHKYVDFVIGGDSDCAPLPDVGILELICHQMGVLANDVLVVANFTSLLLAANKMLMNVVYVPDLSPITPTIEASVYRIVKNPLEIINLFLFAKYDTIEIFSPLLGMSANMDIDTLHETYNHLLKEYADDEGLVRLVKQTYQYFLMEIHDQNTKNKKEEVALVDTAEDSDAIVLQKARPTTSAQLETKIPLVEQTTSDFFETDEDIEEIQVDVDEDTPTNQALTRQKDLVTQATSLNTLIDAINDNDTQIPTPLVEEAKEIKDSNENTTLTKIWNYGIDFLYTTMLSVIIVLAGMIGYIVCSDFLASKGTVSGIIKAVVDGYINFIVFIYRTIFDGLHSFLSFIPDYEGLLTNSPLASKTGMETILYIIFHIILIYIFRWIWYRIKNEEEYEK